MRIGVLVEQARAGWPGGGLSAVPVLVCCPGGWKGGVADSGKRPKEETVMGLATDGWGRVESREAGGMSCQG